MAIKSSKVKKVSATERTLEGLDDQASGEVIPDFIKDMDSSDGEMDDEFISNTSESENDHATDLKGFATAINTILSRDTKSGSGKTSILSEKKDTLEEIQLRREEAALKKQISSDKKEALRKKNIHVEIDVLRKPQEKQLKNLATRGVVQLFNAVMHHRRKKVAEDESVDKVRKRGRPGSLLVKRENSSGVVDFKQEKGKEDKKAKYYKNENKAAVKREHRH